jgi:hypothetical protein
MGCVVRRRRCKECGGSCQTRAQLDANSIQALGPVSSFIGDPNEALRHIERVLDLAPAHYARAHFVSIAGLLQWKLGNTARAWRWRMRAPASNASRSSGHSCRRSRWSAPVGDDATAALARARTVRPGLGPDMVRYVLPFADLADRTAVLDALRQAGLDSA